MWSSLALGTADGDAVDANGGHADADGDTLFGLAAGADALVEGDVVADHGDAVQRLGAVADQRGALDRTRQLAVFDQPGAGGAEREVAGGDVHLAAAERLGVDAVLDRGDDLLVRGLAAGQVGVGHAGDGREVIVLAATVAGRRLAHQRRVHAVLHVALEHAVLDENRALRGRALVVDVERAATAGQVALVDDRAQRGGDLFAHQVAERGRSLTVEVALQ